MMDIFRTSIKPLSGTSYSEIYPKALGIYKHIASKTKRRPYLRSAYFGKNKVFLDYFWEHMRQKNLRDRARRLMYYPCALDLIQNSRISPESKVNPNRKSEMLHRFTGMTTTNKIFHIQVKGNTKNNQKHLISVFPDE